MASLCLESRPLGASAVDGAAHPTHRVRATVLAVVVLAALTTELVWAAPYIGRGLEAIGNANLYWIGLAVAAEISSMMSFARLQRVMLRAGGVDVPIRHAAATAFAGNALSVTLPGGSVLSAAYTSRRFWTRGASAPLIGFAFTATAALSTAALAVLAGVGGTLSGDTSRTLFSAAEIAAAVGLLLGFVLLMRRPDRVRRLLARALRLVHRDAAAAERIAGELSAIRPGLPVWLRAFAFALLNWSADLCCLLAAAHAVGIDPSLQTVVLAYTAAMAAASSIPLLPGGLGVVEAAAVLVLTGGGVLVAAATAAVLVYRLISFGAVALIGWAVVLFQRRLLRRAPARSDAEFDSDAVVLDTA